MQAIVYTGPGELQLLDVEEPTASEGEVVVEVKAVGICGSELEGIATRSPFRKPPLIMGHEFAGIRTDTGERVVVNPLEACGECDLCRAGRSNICRTRSIVGIHRPGAFAPLVAVREENVHTLPDGFTWPAAALVEPIANVVRAWHRADVTNPQRVGILGAGTIGCLALLVAKAEGVPEVHVADTAEHRRGVAESLGASNVAPTLSGEFDLTVDAVGVPSTRQAAVETVRPGGTSMWIGLHEASPGFDAQAFIREEKTVMASFGYTDEDFRSALRLAATLDPWWITEIPLDQGIRVFYELMEGRRDLVKVQLTPWSVRH